MEDTLLKSFLMGGFECSTHRDARGKRLDLIASTRHDEFAASDYARMMEMAMYTARDGVRWHLIEKEPGRFDFSSLKSQVKAARETGIQIIWDYFHYGYPDDFDIFSPDFIDRFSAFSRAVTEYLQTELGSSLFICPVNEISFFSWIAGDKGLFFPCERRRGNELKRQLVRAAIASMDAVRQVCPAARFVTVDPAIHVLPPRENTPSSRRAAENYRRAQFHAFDMLAGRREPALGGDEKYLDILGLNYYFHNQWRHPSRRKIPPGHKDYRALHQILLEFHERYKRPILIAETGIEDDKRPEWFRYVSGQVREARGSGVPVEGICLYPVVNHPGWADDRHCHNGLWDYADDTGIREIYKPLADEIESQNILFQEFTENSS
jgi:beta-glucosidase/6-phospho-beta-glucosidase/beta-galactosidase